jgi:hypothetical protein
MSLLGFDDKIPYSQTNVGRKHLDNQRKARAYLESLQMEKEMDESLNEAAKDSIKETYANTASNKRKFNRKLALRENLKYKRYLTKEFISTFLTETTIKSLVLDDYYIDDNKKQLRESIKTTYDQLYDNGIITESDFYNCKNPKMTEVMLEFNRIIDNVTADQSNMPMLTEDQIFTIINEARKSKKTADEISDIVKDKVTDTVEKENEISKKNKEKDSKEEAEKKDKEEEFDEIDEKNGNKDDAGDDDSLDGGDDDNADSTGDENSDDNDDSLDTDSDDNQDDDASSGDGNDDLGDGSSDDSGDSDSSDDSLDGDDNSTDSTGDENSDDGSTDTSGDMSADDSAASGDGKVSFTFSTDAKKFNFTINKESQDLNLFVGSKRRMKEMKTESSLFKNLMKNSMKEILLTESAGSHKTRVNMDMVLAEAIINYTILECLNTSRIVDFKASDVYNMNRELSLSNKKR